MTQKDTDDMTLEEFRDWATAYLWFGIAQGRELRNLMMDVVIATCTNKIFGGQKNKK